jgi:YHS domain-containing protein
MMRITLAIIFSLLLINVQGQDNTEARKKEFNLNGAVAIQGYDPIAYFSQHKAIKGSKEFAIYHQGITYYFASANNKEEFKKNPSHFEPQYGGWCAYAMAKGEKVNVDPETFKITNDKLYLFYNKFFNNTLKDWNKDENNLRSKADKNWKNIYHQ